MKKIDIVLAAAMPLFLIICVSVASAEQASDTDEGAAKTQGADHFAPDGRLQLYGGLMMSEVIGEIEVDFSPQMPPTVGGFSVGFNTGGGVLFSISRRTLQNKIKEYDL